MCTYPFLLVLKILRDQVLYTYISTIAFFQNILHVTDTQKFGQTCWIDDMKGKKEGQVIPYLIPKKTWGSWHDQSGHSVNYPASKCCFPCSYLPLSDIILSPTPTPPHTSKSYFSYKTLIKVPTSASSSKLSSHFKLEGSFDFSTCPYHSSYT